MTSSRTKTKWSKMDIRNARKADLAAILQRKAFSMRHIGGGNFEVRDHPGLIVKDSYWNWPTQNSHGNTIDFFVSVLGKSFNQAMDIIAGG